MWSSYGLLPSLDDWSWSDSFTYHINSLSVKGNVKTDKKLVVGCFCTVWCYDIYASNCNFSDNCECRRHRFNTSGDGVQEICAEALSSPCNCTINSCRVGESYNDNWYCTCSKRWRSIKVGYPSVTNDLYAELWNNCIPLMKILRLKYLDLKHCILRNSSVILCNCIYTGLNMTNFCDCSAFLHMLEMEATVLLIQTETAILIWLWEIVLKVKGNKATVPMTLVPQCLISLKVTLLHAHSQSWKVSVVYFITHTYEPFVYTGHVPVS